jgi:two-component system phosphate regulon response regulator OmpR
MPNSSQVPHILVVDDDPKVRQMLSRYFEGEGFQITTAEDGAAMRDRLADTHVDLVLLDLVLPGEDGLQLAREIRSRSDVGIIMLTGRSDLVDTVVGLEVGADDYVAKPFQLREVLARVKSVLRRVRPARSPKGDEQRRGDGEVIRFDGWKLEVERRQLTSPDGSDVPLTTGEYDLLLALARNPGRVLDRDRLMDITRGREWEAFDRTIDAQIARLRKKVERDPKHPALIKSVRGVGYVFTGAAGDSPSV